ncbi:hypothetical protein MMC22_004340 [Lobaria immixta]|nr:hypothetical protein [Lobaria immixta]
MGAEFVDFACWAIEEPEILDTEASSDDWNECVDNEGIGERLKNTTLLEDFEDVRYTATYAINNVYDHLEQLNENQESSSNRRLVKTPILSQPKG